MKKLTFVLVLLLTVAIAMPAQANFPDVSADHWAYEAVVELQAAGIVEGYPDGEFKGQQNMTRYEMALIIARMLDDLNMQLDAMEYDIDALYAEVDELSEGLTAAQADDVAAIVQAMLEEYVPEREEGLTAEQSEQVVNLIRALTAEFNTELRMLRDDLGAMEAFAEMTEDNQERIADLEERMDAREVITFRGNYSVNFEHKQVFDADGEDYDFDDEDLNEWTITNIGDFDDYVLFQEDVEFDGTDYDDLDDFINALVADLNDEYAATQNVEDAVDNVNAKIDPDHFQLSRKSEVDYDLPVQDDTVAGFAKDSGFTQSLTLGMDIKTDLFTAGIDLDIVGAEDEISLADAALDIENDFLHAVYSSNNAVSLNDFAVSSETLRRGVSVEFKEWGVDTFFGEYDVDQDVEDLDEVLFDDDEDVEEFERATETPVAADDYLMGLATDISLGDFTIGAGAAMQAPKFDLLGEDSNAVFTAMTGYNVANIDLGVEGAVSYPFDEDEDLGFAFRANAFAETDFADLTLNARYADEFFSALHGNSNVFGTDGDKYEERIVNEQLGVYARADQKIIDLFETGYVEFGLLDEDWRVEAGGSMPLLVDGLTGSASFERLDEYASEEEITDTVKAGALYDVDPLELSLDYTGVMFADEERSGEADYAMANTIKAGAAFSATEELTVHGSYETAMNYENIEDDIKNTLTVGADFVGFEVINNLTLGANAEYSMITGESEGDDLEKNTLTLGLDLEYVIGNAVFSNDLTFVNMNGEDVARDGNRITNVLALDYEIVDGTDLTGSFTQDMMMFDSPNEDSDWTSREVKAGVSIDF